MRHALSQSGKNVFGLLAREFQVKRIGTEIQFTWPFKRSDFGYSNLIEHAASFPRHEYATPSNVAEIDNA